LDHERALDMPLHQNGQVFLQIQIWSVTPSQLVNGYWCRWNVSNCLSVDPASYAWRLES